MTDETNGDKAVAIVNEALLLALAATHPNPAQLLQAFRHYIQQRTDGAAEPLRGLVEIRAHMTERLIPGTAPGDQTPPTRTEFGSSSN